MKVAPIDQNYTGEESSFENLGGEPISDAEITYIWPYRIKLTTESLRWDSLKISPSKEFDDQILKNMSEVSRKALDEWHPVEVSVYDVDTHETYEVKLEKKESFWFEPLPDVGKREENFASSDVKTMEQCSSHKSDERQKNYAYSIQPFRHIVRKRSIRYDQEIGLRWSGSETIDKVEFSVLYSPSRLQLHTLRF